MLNLYHIAGNFQGICKNFVVQTRFVKYKTLKYFRSITLILSIAKIRENCILELANPSIFRALEITSYMVLYTLNFLWSLASVYFPYGTSSNFTQCGKLP